MSCVNDEIAYLTEQTKHSDVNCVANFADLHNSCNPSFDVCCLMCAILHVYKVKQQFTAELLHAASGAY